MFRKLAFASAAALVASLMLAPIVAGAQSYPPQPPPPGSDQQQPPQPPPPGSQDQGQQYQGQQYQGQPYGPPQGGPSYEGPPGGPPINGFHLSGVVAYSVPYFLVLDANGRRVQVHLHDGTIILPTGITLVAGMPIGIDGRWVRGRWGPPSFVADRIVLLQ